MIGLDGSYVWMDKGEKLFNLYVYFMINLLLLGCGVVLISGCKVFKLVLWCGVG